MNVARIAVVAVALAAGGAAFLIAMNYTNAPAPEQAEVEAPTVQVAQVLVAAKDVPIGTKMEQGFLQWRDWPESGITETYISRAKRPNAMAELAGTIARSSFFSGEPVTEAKLVHTDKGYMSAILTSGLRAVATPISVATGAGGFILPNDRVDVIMTRTVEGSASGTEKLVPETILTNVRVLAIDQVIDSQTKDANGHGVVVGQTATLELTAEQAEILTVAQKISDRLTLALRSVADAKVKSTDAQYLLGKGGVGGVTVVRNGVAREVETRR